MDKGWGQISLPNRTIRELRRLQQQLEEEMGTSLSLRQVIEYLLRHRG